MDADLCPRCGREKGIVDGNPTTGRCWVDCPEVGADRSGQRVDCAAARDAWQAAEIARLRAELDICKEMLTHSFAMAFAMGAPSHCTLEEAMVHLVAAPRKEVERLRAELAAAQADLVPLRRLASMIVGWGVTGHAASVEDTAALVRDLFCVNSEGYTHPTPLSQRCIDAAKEAQNGK